MNFSNVGAASIANKNLISDQMWKNTIDYINEALVLHAGKLWLWIASSGPGVAGVGAKPPGAAGSEGFWGNTQADFAKYIYDKQSPSGFTHRLYADVSNSISQYASWEIVKADGSLGAAVILVNEAAEEYMRPGNDGAVNLGSGSFRYKSLHLSRPLEVQYGGTGTTDGRAQYIKREFQNGALVCGGTVIDATDGYIVLEVRHTNGLSRVGIIVQDAAFGSVRTLRSDTDAKLSLGTASFRWTQVYATSGAISTSDAREKSLIDGGISESALRAWGQVRFCLYQMNDALAKKWPDGARIHCGVVAQQAKAAFEAEGLDPFRYGLLCYDAWEAQEEVTETTTDEDGTERTRITMPAREAGDRYGIRYEEALCLEAAYQRWRADKAETRLLAMEARLDALELK